MCGIFVTVPGIEFPGRLVAVGYRGDSVCSLPHDMLCDTLMEVMMVHCCVLDNLKLRCRLFLFSVEVTLDREIYIFSSTRGPKCIDR